jgi:hypothetical protein
MRIKHNKKRNTAFVYEALVREATVAILKNDHGRKNKAVSIIKKHFHGDSLLRRDLDCYRSLYENQNFSKNMSEKIFKEVRIQHSMIDPHGLFKQQTELIHDINKKLSSDVFNNFVVNYKALATIDQIFSSKTSPKNRVILENEIIIGMSKNISQKELGVNVDNILFKTFVEKFNTKYEGELLEEQKDLLVRYISSFSDNALELKCFLNEEIGRLKAQLSKAAIEEEIKTDVDMLAKTNKLIERLEDFAKKDISEEVLFTVLKTQALVKEIYSDGNND